jgi:hypothetical protein
VGGGGVKQGNQAHARTRTRALPRAAEQRHQPKRHTGISSVAERHRWSFRRDAVQELLTTVNTKNDLVRLPVEDASVAAASAPVADNDERRQDETRTNRKPQKKQSHTHTHTHTHTRRLRFAAKAV